MVEIQLVRLDMDLPVPSYARLGDAGWPAVVQLSQPGSRSTSPRAMPASCCRGVGSPRAMA